MRTNFLDLDQSTWPFSRKVAKLIFENIFKISTHFFMIVLKYFLLGDLKISRIHENAQILCIFKHILDFMMLETEHFMEELYRNFRSNYTPEYLGTSHCVTEFERYPDSAGIANLLDENVWICVGFF